MIVTPFDRTPVSLTTWSVYEPGGIPAPARTQSSWLPESVDPRTCSPMTGPVRWHVLPDVKPVPGAPVGLTSSTVVVPAATVLGTTPAIAGVGTTTPNETAFEMTLSGFTTRSFQASVVDAVRSRVTTIDPALTQRHAPPAVLGQDRVRGPAGVVSRSWAFGWNRSPESVTVTLGLSFGPVEGVRLRMYGATALAGPQVARGALLAPAARERAVAAVPGVRAHVHAALLAAGGRALATGRTRSWCPCRRRR